MKRDGKGKEEVVAEKGVATSAAEEEEEGIITPRMLVPRRER